MEPVIQVAALAVTAAVICMVLRSRTGELAVLVSLAGCVLILLLSLRFLKPILEVFQQLRDLSGLLGSATVPLLKVAGIGLLTQLVGSICEDAGEKALRQAVEIGGGFLAVYVSLPLLSAVISLLEETLG